MPKAKPHYEVKGNKVYACISELTEKEVITVRNYIALGKELVETEPVKKTKSIADMRAELAADQATLDKFNAAYKEKAPTGNKDMKKTGFYKACTIYNEWKKAHKAK